MFVLLALTRQPQNELKKMPQPIQVLILDAHTECFEIFSFEDAEDLKQFADTHENLINKKILGEPAA
jgi:hypothetical protein